MIVKVCGMRDADNIREVESLGIDWMGFIFYPPSKRFVGEHAPSYLPSACKRVGVFVNAEPGYIRSMVPLFGLDAIQLHGSESPEFCRELASREPGIRLIKAFSLSEPADIGKTAGYEGIVDCFLFDTPTSGFGGSGRTFDWTLLDGYHGHTPFLLSGGLGPESIDELKGFSHPQWIGIDLNSRFETAPALKDTRALRSFLEQVRTDKKE